MNQLFYQYKMSFFFFSSSHTHFIAKYLSLAPFEEVWKEPLRVFWVARIFFMIDPITLEIQIQILVNKYQKSKINSLHTCIKIDSKPSYLKIWK